MNRLLGKVTNTLKNEGIENLNRKAFNYIKNKRIENKVKKEQKFCDVLFIDGCGEALPHPARYRVTHQREQLDYYNISSNEVFYKHLSVDMIRLYRAFVFFRCPITNEIEKFICLAKKLNKKVFYDIDDLVIDTSYTDMIPYLKNMSNEEKKMYDENVFNMGKLLKMCDAAITSTSHMKMELEKYVPEVFVNRNTASEQMERLSEKVLKQKKIKSTIDIGYFSGSITHNDDFEMIFPVLLKLMAKYTNLRLHLVGELDIPEVLQQFGKRIIIHSFIDWKELPKLISDVDINLAPLRNTLFNKAKSENKWVEAALVKVPTVASDVGAFKEMIVQGQTGVLCNSEKAWENALIDLIENRNKRIIIGEKAYQFCKKNCLTYRNANKLTTFINEHLNENILFVLPSLEISGGVLVALKHAEILQKYNVDVSIGYINATEKWYELLETKLPVLPVNPESIKGKWNIVVATMWSTLDTVKRYEDVQRKMYLVQNYETDFYQLGDVSRKKANSTYANKTNIEYLTISKWCQKWLKEKFEQNAEYIPNGIEFEQFNEDSKERTFKEKIRILIEGDCSSYYKNVDESFKIIEKLDKRKYEIWYMSYNAEPKDWYHIDRFFHKIPHGEVSEIYKKCDILIKTSVLESFSYPPLEMIATGGMVLVLPNDGNLEYLKDRENCIMYNRGEIQEAVKLIEEISENSELRHSLYIKGIETARKRDWKNIEKRVKEVYIGGRV